MSDANPPKIGRWGWVNAVLGILLVALVAASAILVVNGPKAVPGDTKAEKLSRQYDAVTKSARAETLAFLEVDYTAMDKLTAKVLAGATGEFKQEYDQARPNLKTAAETAQAQSSGKVISVGIGDIDSDSAIVFVAADSKVANKSTKETQESRYYRFQLNLVREGDKWLTSKLQFIS